MSNDKRPRDPCTGCRAEFFGLGNTCGDPCENKKRYDIELMEYSKK